jgi:sugar phosphate isomerase/epimerase
MYRIVMYRTVLTIAPLLALLTVPPSHSPAEEAPEWTRHHFAMHNWFYTTGLSPTEQVAAVKRAGYDGLMITCKPHILPLIPEYLAALDQHELRLTAVYYGLLIEDGECPAPLAKLIKQCKGRDAFVSLNLTTHLKNLSEDEADQRAVATVSAIADRAKEAGLRGVVLYPHAGCWLDRVADGARVAAKTNRDDVGTMFNLTHWCREGAPDLDETLRQAMPQLQLVTINGSRSDRCSILPLGQGDFDTFAVVQKLTDLGYDGPIGTIGFSIKGDIPEKLEAARGVWEQWEAKLTGK